MNVGIVGIGNVGSHCAYSAVNLGTVDTLKLVDINHQKAYSEMMDLRDSLVYGPRRIRVTVNELADLGDCDVIVISVGSIISDDHSRLTELKGSVAIVDAVIPVIMAAGFKGIFVSITNPCDIVAYRIWKLSGLPSSHVIGTGTALDTARLLDQLSALSGISAQSIEAFCLGEHGDSQIIPFSTVRINGRALATFEHEGWYKKLDQQQLLATVVEAGWEIFKGKHCTEFGIANALNRILKAIATDERVVLPVSTRLSSGVYGAHDELYASTPCILGRAGVLDVLEYPLTVDEQQRLEKSFDVIASHIQQIEVQG